MNPENIFQGILAFLANTDFSQNILDFTESEFIPVAEFLKKNNEEIYFPASLLHPIKSASAGAAAPVYYNVFWRISSSMMSHLQLECRKSLAELQITQKASGATAPSGLATVKATATPQFNNNLNVFDHLFLEKRPFFNLYDCYYHLTIDSDWKSYLFDEEFHISSWNEQKFKDSSLHTPVFQFFSEQCKTILEKALGNRIIQGNCFIQCSSASPSNSKNNETRNYSYLPVEVNAADSEETKPKNYFVISFGFILNKEQYFRKVEKGPALVNEEDSKKYQVYVKELSNFKEFWGDKSELRRFRDGSILESVVWEGRNDLNESGLQNQYETIDEIIRTMLHYHLPIQRKEISSISTIYQLNNHISFHREIALSYSHSSQENSEHQQLITKTKRNYLYLEINKAFDELKSLIVSQLQNIPLSIDNLLPVSSEFRQTSFHLPEKHPFVQFQFVQENLEKSAFVKENVKNQFLKEYNGKILTTMVTPLQVYCKFESSNKWPKNGDAIQKCKNAFLLKMKFELRKQFQVNGSSCNVFTVSFSLLQMESIVHDNALDVFFKGYLFRLIPFASIENERLVLLSSEMANSAGDNIQEAAGGSISDFILPLANR
jgi:hypothetical protein